MFNTRLKTVIAATALAISCISAQAAVIDFNGFYDNATLATFSNEDITFQSIGEQYVNPGFRDDIMLRLGNVGSFTFDVMQPLDIVFNFTTTRNMLNNDESARLGEGAFLLHRGNAGDSYLYNNGNLASVGDIPYCCNFEDNKQGVSQLALTNVTGKDFVSFQGGVDEVQVYRRFDNFYENPYLIPNDIILTSISYTLHQTPPVPEPETYALMLAGLGIVGFIARRRKIG